MAEPRRSRGSSSRMMPMPSGMAPMAKPCSARPTIMVSRSLVKPQISDPTTMTARLASIIRRLPFRSPRRPMMGVETAPARSVDVMTQVALLGAVLSSVGRSLMTGTSSVCITATTMPEKARTGTMPPLALRWPPAPASGNGCAAAGAALPGSWSVVVRVIRAASRAA